MKTVEQVYQALLQLEKKLNRGVSAIEVSEFIKADRANVSRYLNKLYSDKRIAKLEGRPVLYHSYEDHEEQAAPNENEHSFSRIADMQISLQIPIQQAKAAILYPPRGLHTLILGETGVGKSMFAELMYMFAKESGIVSKSAPFVRFNCADYAENPQLLISQIFGIKKGAYTGADKDRDGLLKKADGGFLFLDEVHRLSPQGQEMLFTFIDKGMFRPLGETDKTVSSDVRIIAATTEEPHSYLLKTFTRRIPMIIELPALRHRDLSEKYYLIEAFIKQESKRIGKSIYASKNSIISFLLYDCPNNIGQLKSDIQLACAKAFVNFKSKKENYIIINPSDLPHNVRKGSMRIHEFRESIDYLLKSLSDVVRYNYKESTEQLVVQQPTENRDFYDIIEQKLKALKTSGLKDEDINQAINTELESNFKAYIGELPKKISIKDISSIIDEQSLAIVKDIVSLAQTRLDRSYDEKIYIALALHMQGFIDRVKKGTKIYHPRLNMIRVEHPDEFMTAMEAAKMIDASFGIHTPLDEIGYITMFLAADTMELAADDKSKVGILVIMHGNSTASSMTDVCNTLIGTLHVHALDMPLSMSSSSMYELARDKVKELDRGRGVLLMVDMGSLVNFGDMINDDTGIVIKTIDMVSTPLLIEACRKAILGRDIYNIYDSLRDLNIHPRHDADNPHFKEGIIITACFTGEGASERLKQVIEDNLQESSTIKIIPINIMSKKDLMSRIEQLKKEHNVLAIVSTIGIEASTVPFISAADILGGDGLSRLQSIISYESDYSKISESLKKHLININSEKVIDDIRYTVDYIEQSMKVSIKNEVKIGIMLHMSFLIDKLKGGGKETIFANLTEYKNQYDRELLIIKSCIQSLEKKYGISVGENEIAYICKMYLSNNEVG